MRGMRRLKSARDWAFSQAKLYFRGTCNKQLGLLIFMLDAVLIPLLPQQWLKSQVPVHTEMA